MNNNMYCKNCGNKLNENEVFCSVCGTKVQNDVVVENTMNYNFSNTAVYEQTISEPQQPKKKKNNLITILAIIGGVVAVIVIAVIIIIAMKNVKSEKLVCKSKEGNITIMYNKEEITGYTATGIVYDLDEQKEVAKIIGVDAYMKEFDNWFRTNTSGVCTINGKEISEENEENEDTLTQDIEMEGKRVGSDEFGYITIPENWVNFVDTSGSGTLQYSYANTYIATLYAVPTTQIDSYNYANNIMSRLQKEGVQNLKTDNVSIGKYSAYKISGYYPNANIWLVCWIFDDENGKTHYISIEGPDNTSEYFNIPNTFSLIK